MKDKLKIIKDNTISKIDKVLSNYYLSEFETGISDFYSRLEKLIKGRLNNENWYDKPILWRRGVGFRI